MSEWWTYTLSDFLMFAPRTYARLIELHNQALWPLQGIALLLGLAALLMARKATGWRRRAVAAILASAWAFVGWAFHHERYATINWIADYFALAFGLQAVLLLVVGVLYGKLEFRFSTHPVAAFAVGLAVVGLLVYPAAGIGRSGSLASAEVFGVTPDPTALVTLGLLLLVSGRTRWMLMVVPLLWCLVGGATLWTLGAPEAWLLLGAGALALVMGIWKGRRRRRPSEVRAGM